MKKYLAEFIGTFALVFCGTGAVIVNSLFNNSIGLLGVSVSFGVTITAIVYVFGSISGAHINPAVTIALGIRKVISKKEVIGYIVWQILGALMASGLLKVVFYNTTTLGETLPTGGVIPSFVLEAVLTFFLMLTILGVSENKNYSHLLGIVLGALVMGFILIAGPISGGSFNPARSLAPLLFTGNLHIAWLYFLAPVIGAITANYTWLFISKKG
ncbi:MIP/aquaporin family protein [Tenacibaculum halocynthiae]|uniref:MIP/aquaporin family protein n=1 Tax=Tenacibaculum halocynthiae TaxID=1254437 RepID=UPI003D64EDBE